MPRRSEDPVNLYLSINFTPLVVPYLGYVDLRREPHRQGEIPELREWPALADLVADLNAPTSVFSTVGCGHWTQGNAPRGTNQCVGYVGFCFADPERNKDPLGWYAVYHRLAERAQQHDLPKLTEIRVDLCPTLFCTQDDLAAWSVDFNFQAFDDTTEGARSLAEATLRLLRDFTAAESTRLRADNQ